MLKRELNWKNEFFITDYLGNTRVTFDGVNGYLTSKDYFDVDPYSVPLQAINQSSYSAVNNNFKMQGKEEFGFGLNGLRDFGARFSDATIGGIWNAVDPLAEKREWLSPYNYVQNNPILRIDPDGNFDFVQNTEGKIYWDKNANSQTTTKSGETYLGKNLNFVFNSNINNTFDGPRPPWNVTGDKLTSTINVKGNEDKNGNLTSIDVKSSYSIGETGGIDMFKGRDYFPELGVDQNKAIDAKGMTTGSVTFEQHASVPGLESFGLNMLGYDVVNVAQKLTIGLSGNNLSVSAATDIFPSASLSVNGTNLFNYSQPSFKATHGRFNTSIGDNETGGGYVTSPSSGRPAPSFINRYKK